MNEVEKMYENAELRYYYCGDDYISEYMLEKECTKGDLEKCKKCMFVKRGHSPFTAEKQIEVENIIFQCNFGICELQRTMPAEFTKDNRFVKHYFAWQYHAGDIGYYNETIEEPYGDWDVECSNSDRKEALAGFVNVLWDEHLTEEERKQIKKYFRGITK